MIVPMCKTYITARSSDCRQLVDAVADLGIVHLTPIDPATALPDEETRERIETLRQALQILGTITAEGAAPSLPVEEAAREALEIIRRRSTHEHRLTELYHELRQIDIWGNLELKTVSQLSDAGINLQFYSVPTTQARAIEADCAEIVGQLPGRKSIVAIVNCGRPPKLPDTAAQLTLPPRDAPSLKAEAAHVDAAIKEDRSRLRQLAHLSPLMEAELTTLQQQADETVALRGARTSSDLFAIQGWIPQEKATTIADHLAETGIPAAVRVMEPADNEEPPTCIRQPAWTRPIEGLFSIMGTVAGYREFDVSVPFLIAMPIFTAILISDGGYGAILLLALTLVYRPATRALGTQFTHLLMVVAAVTLLWGTVCATFFGVTVYSPLIPVNLTAQSRSTHDENLLRHRSAAPECRSNVAGGSYLPQLACPEPGGVGNLYLGDVWRCADVRPQRPDRLEYAMALLPLDWGPLGNPLPPPQPQSPSHDRTGNCRISTFHDVGLLRRHQLCTSHGSRTRQQCARCQFQQLGEPSKRLAARRRHPDSRTQPQYGTGDDRHVCPRRPPQHARILQQPRYEMERLSLPSLPQPHDTEQSPWLQNC